jgi:hypothetical protein
VAATKSEALSARTTPGSNGDKAGKDSKRLDRLRPVGYNINKRVLQNCNCRLGPLRKERNGTFIIDDSGNTDSVNPPRRGNNVDDAIDNLTKRHNAGELGPCLSEDRYGRKSQDRKP